MIGQVLAANIIANPLLVNWGGPPLSSPDVPTGFAKYDNGGTGGPFVWTRLPEGGPKIGGRTVDSWRVQVTNKSVNKGFVWATQQTLKAGVPWINAFYWKGNALPEIATNTPTHTVEWLVRPPVSAVNWQLYVVKFIPSADSPAPGLQWHLYSAPASYDVQVAAWSAYQGSTAEYGTFSGETPLGRWQGAPHSSMSNIYEYVEGEVSEDLVAAHEPWITDDLATYLRAIGGMFAEVELYAFDTDEFEGWTILLDVDRVPVQGLPYLAQYVGERLPRGLTEEAQRQWVRDAPNQRRGTLSSIVDAAQRFLTGARIVTVIEREGGADKITVVTYTDQTPSSARVLAELNKVIPADISLTYVVNPGQIWSQVVATDADWTNSMAESATWADLIAETPGGTYG
jgi:hypothetical protein